MWERQATLGLLLRRLLASLAVPEEHHEGRYWAQVERALQRWLQEEQEAAPAPSDQGAKSGGGSGGGGDSQREIEEAFESGTERVVAAAAAVKEVSSDATGEILPLPVILGYRGIMSAGGLNTGTFKSKAKLLPGFIKSQTQLLWNYTR